eukprot:CAMPEP_0119063186 /NCGR_PEP_ID=MMETSP1178-20130426/6586_1 /TAXON_ID=33656 /ORGANISM="unid sp, Strain CCMP2000" /LENGTH=91 /DNA_ID=CAMNT_0007044527 /DNA_START=259 /DNA_END=533 /DNA_ORIENTATION=+
MSCQTVVHVEDEQRVIAEVRQDVLSILPVTALVAPLAHDELIGRRAREDEQRYIAEMRHDAAELAALGTVLRVAMDVEEAAKHPEGAEHAS